MIGFFLRKFRGPIFWGTLLTLFLGPPSFAQDQPETAGGLSIQTIEVTKLADGFRVTIEGSKPFEYTVFKMANPLRVVVDLPEAQLGKLTGPMEVKNGLINVIQSQKNEDPQKPGARVEIGLDRVVEYNVTSEGNYLYVDLGKAVAELPKEVQEAKATPAKQLPKAKSMKEVAVIAKSDLVEVDIKGDGLVSDYRSFSLSRPPRLIVDLLKITNTFSKKNIDVGSRLLKDIRIGQHPDKIRLVLTFPGLKVPPYKVIEEGPGLKVFLGKIPEASRKEKAPVQVAAAETPAAVAKPEAAPPAPSPEQPAVTEKVTEKAVEMGAAPGVSKPSGPSSRERMSLNLTNADIHDVLRLIAEVSNMNVIAAEDVKGKITLRLVNVPWDQALEVILAHKNLVKAEEGNIIRISTMESVRKEMDDRQKEQESLAKSIENKEKAEDLVTETIFLNYAKALDMQKLVMGAGGAGGAGARALLSPTRGSVRADDRTNTLTVQDIRSRVEEIQNLIKKLDFPTPQVIIEARVVQAQTSFVRSLGVQWGGSYNQTDGGKWFWGLTGNNPTAAAGWGFAPSAAGGAASTPLIMPSNFVVNFPASTASTAVGGMGISFGKLTGNLINLDLRLQLGETDSVTRVIARPKLATLTNREAIIKQGEKIPYETTSQAGTSVQFIDAVLSLKVTPTVTPDNSILMKVVVTRDARGTFRSPINQVPSIDNREASTEVLVKDGETLVIGGIYETDTAETTQGIPWLMRIPVLGWLFKNRDTEITKKELLIFITPTIITQAKTET